MEKRFSYPREKIKILLLEKIHADAIKFLKDSGYTNIKSLDDALSEDELSKAIKDVHILGIRSKTKVTKKVLESATRLLSIGCFCIGTDQVKLDEAARKGVPVFNAPFSNTRSVAELTMAEIVMLARKAAERSTQMHQGLWEKSATDCYEVRHKTLGIIGYGHIGGQVGILAEAFGMKVLFYDITKKLPLGNAQALTNLKEVLQCSDFVTLHVPETPETRLMIGKKQLAQMKRGAHLLNLSRGSVVDLPALKEALQSGHISGAALDVYPKEPEANKTKFQVDLAGVHNVILTPHIGGSTQEAQKNIGLEVSSTIISLLETGSTTGAVNFPQIDLPILTESHRILNVHKNVPGVLSKINSIVAATGANINAQYLGTLGDIGYLIMDVGPELSEAVKKKIDAVDANIKTRMLM